MKCFPTLLCIFLNYCALVYGDARCSSSGEYAIISKQRVNVVTADNPEVRYYQPTTQLPTTCDIDRTCRSELLEVDTEKHLWVPNSGQAHYLKLIGIESVEYGPSLHGNDCFYFFHIEDNVLGALCTEPLGSDKLIVPYRIEYRQDGLRSNQLGFTIYLDVDDHSPIIALNNINIVGITYADHLSAYRLFIIYYGSNSYDDEIDVPAGCLGPHDLQPIGQYDAIIRCASGKLLHFNGEYLTFDELPYNNIAVVSTCTNSTSFVMVQNTGDIIFNKSVGLVYRISVNTGGQQLNIASAACYATGGDEITYYFMDTISHTVYKLYLGDIFSATSQQAISPQAVISDVTAHIILYVDSGPVLWAKAMATNSSDAAVHIVDLLTDKHISPIPINGPTAFVQLYTANKCTPSTGPKQQASTGSKIRSTLVYTIPVLAVTIITIAVIIIIVVIVHHRRRRRNRAQLSCRVRYIPRDLEHEQNSNQSETSSLNNDSTQVLLMPNNGSQNNQAMIIRSSSSATIQHSTPVQSCDEKNSELVSQPRELVHGRDNIVIDKAQAEGVAVKKMHNSTTSPVDQPD